MSTTIPAAATELTNDQVALQLRAREFVERVLLPLELAAEAASGRLPGETVAEIKRQAIRSRLQGGRMPVELGGQGWTMVEWFLANEQFGRVTNGLHWHVPSVYNVWAEATPDQVERYVVPALRGEGGDAYAVTEAEAGSDASGIATTAVAVDGSRTGGWRINGEKWFVTSGDVARVLIVMTNVVDGADRLPTLFLVEPQVPGVEFVDDPRFTHNYPHGHPTIRFTDVEVAADAVVGGVGNGDELQRRWFTEERLGIATHGLGAMWRLLDETTDWALTRVQGGQRIIDYQGISFPLADSATDAAVGRLLTLQVCALIDAGADPKLIHAKASMAKLFVSEAAGRCADRAVQAFGGRGYLRSNVAERFLRELRVDRIWEGTSEIQRLIIARALERRGVEATIH
ncbi:MAG TPA: acyl-CoA dehydrogenase family protein [Solirubrobacteraceae bacterium]|jgi:alkylation response protein AidB-like acyl-CoA dehydrogenase|nr:acyl-CoA dehydrogenase family protein [Solirubrobacteraceae bacterium]